MGGKIVEMECLSAVKLSRGNMVFREVVSREGCDLGVIGGAYDGTLEDAVRVAKEISARMFDEYIHASNGESRIRVTDATGKAKWRISPNFAHVDELGRPPTELERSLIREGLMIA